MSHRITTLPRWALIILTGVSVMVLATVFVLDTQPVFPRVLIGFSAAISTTLFSVDLWRAIRAGD
jgi:hypothetical protein